MASDKDWSGISYNLSTWARNWKNPVARTPYNYIRDIAELGNVVKRDHREQAVTL